MAPERLVATLQRTGSRSQSNGVRNPTKATPLKKTTQVRQPTVRTPISSLTPKRRYTRSSYKTRPAQAPAPSPIPSTVEPPLQPVQQDSGASQHPTRRKRNRGLEHEHPNKRQRQQSSPLPIEPAPSYTHLTSAALEEWNRRTVQKALQDMDSPVVSSGRGEKKRSLSRRSSTTETNPDTVSVGSQKTSSLANYRYNNLNYARIVVEGELIPKDIASRIDAIIQPEISSEKRDELFLAAETLCNDFAKIIVESSREDDSVELMYHALACIDKDKKFAFPRKADFDPNLKPIIQRKVLQWNISTDNSTEDFPTRLAKRQQPDAACVSPANSDPSIMRPVAASIPVPPQGPETIMAPPPLPSRPDISAVKNPRPDITVGLSARIVIDKLIARGFSDFDAEEALVALQKQLTFSLSALQPAFKMLFPPMVVEGKSYSTGKPIFEAENQAAVSGSCMCNQQYKLAEFTELVSCVPRGSRVPPLAFSICTEGPVLELWAHYATSVRDIRTYNMNILKICRVSRRPALQKEVAGFLEAVYGIMEWASTEFLDGVVEQLVLLWDAGQ